MIKIILFSCGLLIVFHSGCGIGHHPPDEEGVMLASIFPYTEKSKYYEDVQLVSKVKEDNSWNYQFIVAIVDADNEQDQVDIEVRVESLDGNLLCPRYISLVNRTNNHIELPRCKSATQLGQVRVVLNAGTNGNPRELVKVHDFDLSGL